MPTILVICTGNVCRSPLAEAVLREQGGLDGLTFHSAGTDAFSGQSRCERVLEMGGAPTVGRDLNVAKAVTPDSLDEADLILAAEYEHRGAVGLLRPMARRKTFTLKEASLFISTMVADHARGRRNERVTLEEQFASVVREMNNMRGAVRLAGRKRPMTVFQLRTSGSAADLEIADGHWGSDRQHRRTLREVSLASQQVGAGLAALLSRPQ